VREAWKWKRGRNLGGESSGGQIHLEERTLVKKGRHFSN